MKARLINLSLWLALGLSVTSAVAEDTDLFVGNTNSSSSGLPNVLFIIDNSANWNTAFDNEKAALKSVFDSLSAAATTTAGKVRVGVMLFSETGSGNSNPSGGYVRAAIREMNSTNATKYSAFVNGLSNTNPNSDKGNGRSLGLGMVEAYYYYAGSAPYAGNNKVKTDYTGNSITPTATYAGSNGVYALSGNALTSKSSTSYVSPVTPDGCQKNYIIYIGNSTGTVSKDNSSENSTATDKLTAAGGDTTTLPLSPSGFQDNIADEWARFMKVKSPLAITTYTIDVDPPTTGNGPANTALLKSMASVSGGRYFTASSSTSTEITSAINTILGEIQSVNSVFASVSLPVSVNTQGTYSNQIFIGMFRPDADALPRWKGNLKQYKIGISTTTSQPELQDADSKSAINLSTGFVTECARSFWTPTSVDTYWNFSPQGGCIDTTIGSNLDYSNYPDGKIVEKGAQAYMARNNTSRTMKTCGVTSCTSLVDFNTTNVSQSDLGASSATEQTQLVNWAKGFDVDDENTTDGVTPASNTSTVMRPSIHGDVVHSRPIAINYGTDAAPQVVVYYGGNDGVLRAVNGNRTAAIGSTAAGAEFWAFMAPESYTNIKRERDNSITVKYKGTTDSSAQDKPYGVDGPIISYSTSTTTWIYATMRRGGRSIYAFDVTTPSSPSLKWRKGCPTKSLTDDTNCSTGMTGMGQSWASPVIVKASNTGSTPLMIIGGGYDTCEDADPNTCTSSSKGHYVYILNADTGALLNTLTTSRGVTGDVTVVTDSDGNAKYAYLADLGGNIYRINIGTAAPAAWTLTQIASLGCSTTATCSANRKFMFAPDVVYANSKYYILVGSGDREKPLSTYTTAAGVTNYFFMVNDDPTDGGWLSSQSSVCDGNSVICLASLVPVAAGSSASAADLATKKGWYLALQSGEQVVTSSITLYGVTTFSTHQPTTSSSTSCSANLGTARVYNVDFENASSENGTSLPYETVTGGGLSPSPIAVKVTLDDGSTTTVVFGSSKDSFIAPGDDKTTPSGTSNHPRRKVYWYLEQ